MVQQIDVLGDGQTIASTLIERIINEVLKVVCERTNSEDLDYSGLMEKAKDLGSDDRLPSEVHMSDPCYRDFPTVASSVSATSKQGEGDFQHPQMREAAAFYCLQPEVEECGNDDGSSLNTETSAEELIAALKDQINNLSFDNVQLSDSEADDGLRTPLRLSEPEASSFAAAAEQSGSLQVLEDDDTLREIQNPNDFIDTQSVLKQSQKFCLMNSKQYFPFDSPSSHAGYCQFVDENQNLVCKDEEEQELLSRSSEELVIIDGDEDYFTTSQCAESNTFRDSVQCSVRPSTIALPVCSASEPNPRKIQVIACVEPNKERSSWEESNEVQVNITNTESDRNTITTTEEDGAIVQTRNYWSNVGLMSEKVVDPRHLGPVDQPGIESVKNMNMVEIKHLKHNFEEIICHTGRKDLDQNKTNSNTNSRRSVILEDSNINYLTCSNKKNDKKRKKKNIILRLAGSITNLLRPKKKNFMQ